jgi:hypothetical protein
VSDVERGKPSLLAQYSSRLGRSNSVRLLRGWLEHLRAHLTIEGASFNLDIHAVPFLGEDEFVQRHERTSSAFAITKRSLPEVSADDFDTNQRSGPAMQQGRPPSRGSGPPIRRTPS